MILNIVLALHHLYRDIELELSSSSLAGHKLNGSTKGLSDNLWAIEPYSDCLTLIDSIVPAHLLKLNKHALHPVWVYSNTGINDRSL